MTHVHTHKFIYTHCGRYGLPYNDNIVWTVYSLTMLRFGVLLAGSAGLVCTSFAMFFYRTIDIVLLLLVEFTLYMYYTRTYEHFIQQCVV